MNKLLIVFSLLMLAIYVNGTCIEGTLACTTCTSDKCTGCKEGFFVSTGDLCAKCSANCLDCTSASVCNTCAVGFYKTSANACTACKTNCAKCTTDADCTVPKDGYWISVGGAEGVTATLTQSMAHCKISYTIQGDPNTEACVVPEFGFSSSDAPLSEALDANCQFARDTQCIYPKAGWFIKDFFIACDADCLFCVDADNTAKCTECVDPTKRPDTTDDTCSAVSGITDYDHCLLTDGTDCTLCMYGYGGADCQVCNAAATDANTCAYCGSNSYYTLTRRRQLPTYLETTDELDITAADCTDFAAGAVVKPSGNCAFFQYETDTVTCLWCKDMYGPNTKTAPGTAGFDVTDCDIKCYEGCDSCTAGDDTIEACTDPSDGYYLQLKDTTGIFVGSCIHEDCVMCDGPFIYDCTLWKGFVLGSLAAPEQFTTTASYANCLVYATFTTATDNTCLYPNDGYYVKDKVATACVANCAICDGADYGGCNQAAVGFFLDTTNSKIAACITNCDECQDATTCDTCKDGYGYDSTAKKCVNQCLSNCASCWSSTACDVCEATYTLNSTTFKCDAAATTSSTTSGAAGTTYGFLFSTIACMISLILILMI